MTGISTGQTLSVFGRRRAMPPVLAGLVVLLLAGCHSYSRVDLSEVDRGDVVRARIEEGDHTDSAAGEVDGAGPVEGRAAEVRRDSIVLELFATPVLTRGRATTLHERVALGTQEIRSLELRRTDVLETGILVGGGALLVTGFILQRASSGGGVIDEPGGSTPQGLSVPLPAWIP